MNEQDIERIKIRAYFHWQYRMEFGMLYALDNLGNIREIGELDDWLLAENDYKQEAEQEKKDEPQRFY